MTTSGDRVEEVARDVLGAATDSLVQIRDRPETPGLLTRMLVSDHFEAAEDAAELLRECRAARSALRSYLGILLACDVKYASTTGEKRVPDAGESTPPDEVTSP